MTSELSGPQARHGHVLGCLHPIKQRHDEQPAEKQNGHREPYGQHALPVALSIAIASRTLVLLHARLDLFVPPWEPERLSSLGRCSRSPHSSCNPTCSGEASASRPVFAPRSASCVIAAVRPTSFACAGADGVPERGKETSRALKEPGFEIAAHTGRLSHTLATWYRELVDDLPVIEAGQVQAPTRPGLGTTLKPEVKKRDDAVVRCPALGPSGASATLVWTALSHTASEPALTIGAAS